MLQLRLQWDVPFALPGGMRIWVAAAHALSAFAGMMVFGALLPLHIRYGLRRRVHRKSGISLIVVMLALSLSALGIYYFGDDTWSAVASSVHVLVGLAACLVLTLHVILARRRARRLQQQAPRALAL